MIEDDLLTIMQELRKTSDSNFTGTVVLKIHMGDGGISQMSLNLERNLKKSAKKAIV